MSAQLATTTELETYLVDQTSHLAAALPDHLRPERMIRLALTAFEKSRDLRVCTQESIYGSILLAAQMGLEIGVSGQGYLVPLKGQCTFVPGWQGIVDIVNRAGRAVVWTGAVFEGDLFDYELGDRPFVKHKPMGEDDPTKITHCYAVGRITGSDWPVIEVWPIARIAKHFRKFNKVGEKHYAHKNWEMYARKVPLLQVCKYMPKSIELTTAMQASYQADSGADDVDERDGEITDGAGQVVGKTSVMPQRKSQPAAQQASAPAASTSAPAPTKAAESPTESDPATEGERNWVKLTSERKSVGLDEVLGHVGKSSLDKLTKSDFKSLQTFLKGR